MADEKDPVATILTALSHCGDKQADRERFIAIFEEQIKKIQTVDGLHALLIVLKTDAIVKPSGIRMNTRLFVCGENIECKIKDQMCLCLGKILSDPEAKFSQKKVREIKSAIDFTDEDKYRVDKSM